MRLNNLKKIPVLILLSIISLILCCESFESKRLAEKRVAEFRQQMNEKSYRNLYSEADLEFKRVTSEEDALNFFSAVEQRLGKVKHAELQDWRVTYISDGKEITMIYKTTFEDGVHSEKFIWLERNGKISLYSYEVY